MKKRFKIVITVIMMLALLMPTVAFAATPADGGNCSVKIQMDSNQIQKILTHCGINDLSELNVDSIKECCKNLIPAEYIAKFKNIDCNKIRNTNNCQAEKQNPVPPEAPKTEAPKTEAPKTEAPKTEAPKTEAPAPEAPKAEAPKTEAPKTEAPKTEALDSYEAQVVDLVNKERAAQGLPALKYNAELSKVAEAKAVDLRDKGYFDHNSPTYGSPFDMMKQFGITYRAAGENIAKGYRTPAAVMDGWMNSPGHKANIMSGDFTEIGVGYVTDSSGAGYWVQMFIRP